MIIGNSTKVLPNLQHINIFSVVIQYAQLKFYNAQFSNKNRTFLFFKEKKKKPEF